MPPVIGDLPAWDGLIEETVNEMAVTGVIARKMEEHISDAEPDVLLHCYCGAYNNGSSRDTIVMGMIDLFIYLFIYLLIYFFIHLLICSTNK
jgi:hypothetical protein